MADKQRFVSTIRVFQAASVLSLGVYVGFHGYKIYQLPTPDKDIHDPRFQNKLLRTIENLDPKQIYSSLASSYDKEIGWDEWLMGMGGIRRRLLENCKGNVLEISAGTGRNIKYYPIKNLKSITFTDNNTEMLLQSLQKVKDNIPFNLPVRHLVSDAQTLYASISANKGHPDASVLSEGGYDTVVDSFGLCSCGDPVEALKNMAKCCREDGKLLLLEHGRVAAWRIDWGILGKLLPAQSINSLLDRTALGHASKWGCWWNRDILEVVEKAGLQVETVKRFHFGTTYLVVAHPKKKLKF
ncbi:Methyltransferase-like protein 7B [Nowakowskiella sp. JEL0078]|nr:Methyltransferase-like protein 7B [Nowakowskiella sp. JEL0078]